MTNYYYYYYFTSIVLSTKQKLLYIYIYIYHILTILPFYQTYMKTYMKKNNNISIFIYFRHLN